MYVPSTVPGGKLPHHWLADEEGVIVSTHDLLNRRSARRGGAPNEAAAAPWRGCEAGEPDRGGELDGGAARLDNGVVVGPRLTLMVDAEGGAAWWEAAEALAAGHVLRVVAIAATAGEQ